MEYWSSVANQHSEYWLSPAHPVVPPTASSARAIADAYWTSLVESLKGAVRSEGDPLGPIRLVVARTGLEILRFDRAEVDEVAGGVEVSFPITGGRACSGPAGELRIVAAVEGDRVRLGVVVDGYRPRFERLRVRSFPIAAPYTLGQHLVHRFVTTRSLRRIAAVIDPYSKGTRRADASSHSSGTPFELASPLRPLEISHESGVPFPLQSLTVFCPSS